MTVEALTAPDERLPEDPASAASPAAPGPETITGVVMAGAATAGVVGIAGVAGTAGVAGPIGVRVLDSGIVQVTLPPNEEIAGAEARVAGAAVRALAHGRRVPVMLVLTGVVGVSVEARQIYVSSIAASALALVGESPVDRVIAHYLLR
ncbi:MAG: hypothetical protein JWO34_1218, partial [Arthrobacter sp.]|nr:hypothetical protein [Arthrobacter sp.]